MAQQMRLRKNVLFFGVGAAVSAAVVVVALSMVDPGGGDAAPVAADPSPVTVGANGRLAAPPPNNEFTPAYYGRFSAGLPAATSFFPIAVWDQSPVRERNGQSNAVNYRSLGINTFAGLWAFPTDPQSGDALAAIQSAGLYALAGGDAGAVKDIATVTAMPGRTAWAGFQIGDEEDMSTNPTHITPEQVATWGAALHKADPTHPVYNNFGKAFSLYPWVGAHDEEAGLRTYCSNVDIPSSDYYAATDGYEPANMHTPRYYGQAIDHVRELCGANKPAWGFVETGHPGGRQASNWPPYSAAGVISPATIEQAVWSMLAHGANGIVYFVHDFLADGFTEDGVFDHPAAVQVVTKVNATIRSLAPILNAARQPGGVRATHADATLRADAKGWYVVAAENSGEAGTATFTLPGAGGRTVEVVGENRRLTTDANGTWHDEFAGWGHHVYRLAP